MRNPIRPQGILALALLATTAAQAQVPLKTRASVGTTLARVMVAAPTNVAVIGDHQSATISWAAVANAVSYRVLRSPDPNVQGQDLTTPITATNFVDPTLIPGATLYYSVVATSGGGLTATSAPVAYAVPATLQRTLKGGARTFALPAPPPPLPPPPVVPAGTSVVPSTALPGQTVRVLGQGFSALTAVKTGATNLTWAPVSDTEISLTLPGPVAGLFGSQSLPVSLYHNVPGVAPGTVQPAPVVLHPPMIEFLNTNWAECCEVVGIHGRGLTYPMTVTVGGVSVALLGAGAHSSFRVPLLPTNDPGGPKTVEVRTAGGVAVSQVPLTIVKGPSEISSIVPNVFQSRQTIQITVHGTNLFRAVGICLPGITQPLARNDVPLRSRPTGPLPPSNDQMTVLIDRRDITNPLTGPVALAMPPTVPTGTRSYYVSSSSVCQPNPTAVNITAQ